MEQIFWLSDQDNRVLIDNLQDGIFVIEDERLVYVNQRLADMLGYQISELLGRSFMELVAHDDRTLALERYRARISGEVVPNQYDLQLCTSAGSVIICALNISIRKPANGRTSTIGSARNITTQKSQLAEMEASKMELKSIFDQLPDVFYRTNMQGIITLISPSCFDILGYRQEVMLGSSMADYYVNPDDRKNIVQAITDGGGKATSVEAGLKHKNGSVIWISTSAIIRYNADGMPVYIEGIARDISDRKQMEDKLIELSRTDSLTGVYNRSYFMSKSEEIINMMQRYRHPVSMMMSDLDHFKMINDNFGHQAGDLALVAFTKVCKQEIRDSDVLGRLGGEEFGLMLPETSIDNAQALAERIRKATDAIMIPFGDHIIRVTVSIGLVELGIKDQTLEYILRRADKAMYRAKEKGRNQVVTSFETLSHD